MFVECVYECELESHTQTHTPDIINSASNTLSSQRENNNAVLRPILQIFHIIGLLALGKVLEKLFTPLLASSLMIIGQQLVKTDVLSMSCSVLCAAISLHSLKSCNKHEHKPLKRQRLRSSKGVHRSVHNRIEKREKEK